jgi:hypothetical protein
MYESTCASSRIRKEAFAFICPSRTGRASGRKCRRSEMVNFEAVIDLTKISKLDLTMTPMRAIRLHGGHVIARCDFSGRALGAPLRIPVICIRHFEKSGYFVPSSLILRELTTDIVDLSCTIVRWALPPPADAARGGKVLDLIFPKLPPLIGRCNVACNRSTK